jgi:hypothetical protein
MIKKTIILVVYCISYQITSAQNTNFLSADIERFWEAFDKIKNTTDSIDQIKIIQTNYIDKASEGLKDLIAVRNYSAAEYVNAIKLYPNFWTSMRKNSIDTKILEPAIETDIAKLKAIYPSLNMPNYYFLIGALRTNGTINNQNVLIGCELALADESTVITEFPEFRQHYFKTNHPKKNLALLCVHETIHTQQKEPVDNLLSYCIYEGVAEYLSCLATGKKSNTPAIAFGKANYEKVIKKFKEDIFFYRLSDWLWGENGNELVMRDLGYYIGYEISERYYTAASNKSQAIYDLINLDYTNEKAVEAIVDNARIFDVPLSKMWDDYNALRPIVSNINPLNKEINTIPSGIIKLSITFSEAMDTTYRGFDYGPLGADYIYEFKKVIGWSNNDKTFTIEINTLPKRKYQTYITTNFRNKKGIRLKPYLIEFDTQ